ncbi:uncharacterized protein LOC119734070 [Patiria miniata]|uniref:BESS domain-containing protein n=1 Tax=Patiria miniata TaxID=46514 RepID=A0A914AI21_PATMI|nr:uncharacterized protein LOC119734070 [Patiria miniata]
MDSLLGEFQDLVETHGNIEVCFEEPKDDTSSGTTGNELPCSNILAVPYPPKKRIQEFDILEDALLKSINATNEDSLFAQSVGQTLQRLGNAQKALAKIKIMQILFEAEASSPAE